MSEIASTWKESILLKNGSVLAAVTVAKLLCCSSVGRREKPSEKPISPHLYSLPGPQQMPMDPQSGPDLHIDESKQVHVKYSMAGQQLVVDTVVLFRPLFGKTFSHSLTQVHLAKLLIILKPSGCNITDYHLAYPVLDAMLK